MFILVLLFGMFIATSGDSNITLSNGDILHEVKPSSCEVKCDGICQVCIQDRCQRCYRRCWLMKVIC